MVRLAPPRSDTAFASARRTDSCALESQRAALLADGNIAALLDAMPGPAMIVNTCRQIVLINREACAMLGDGTPDDALGLRPGEAVKCIHHDERAGGCGTAPACGQCGAVRSVLDCFAHDRRASHECRLTVRDGANRASLDLRVHASPLSVGDHRFAVVALQDIGAEKRREALEQTLLHDLANTCVGLQHVARQLSEDGEAPDLRRERGEQLRALAEALGDQLSAHRDLRAAERGELLVCRRELDVRALLESTLDLIRTDPLSEGRALVLESGRAARTRTDPVLLSRVVGNLVRNALEATRVGGTVSVFCARQYGGVTVSVHNEGEIPEAVQHQIFQRSFTTKAGRGRGLGTYGARLLTERYLGGDVGFMSNEHTGTVFVVTLP